MLDPRLWGLLPPGPPPRLGPELRDGLGEDGFEPLPLRAYLWTHFLLAEVAEGRALSRALRTAFRGDVRLADIADVSAGFIPFEPGSGDARARACRNVPHLFLGERSWCFGVVVGVDLQRAGERVGEDREPASTILVAGFPVVCEPRRIVEHAPPNPAGAATSACYARPRASAAWSEGIVTARHVLTGIGAAVGTAIPMSGGGSMPIADIDPATTIDAAILDGGAGTIPAAASRLRVGRAAPGSTVAVRGARTRFSPNVLRVMDDSRYFGNMVAHRTFLDAHGRRGDSGALVTRGSDGVGIYMGDTGGSPAEGLVQLLRQVTRYFDIDLYD